MNVLYYMDPFIDIDAEFDDRSFVAKIDLNADFLGNYSKTEKSLHVYFVALESLLQRREIRQHLTTSGVSVISIPDKEIKGILSYHNTTENMIFSGVASQEAKDKIKSYLSRKLAKISPDFIIYWESCVEQLHEVFPDAIFMEGSHTGFYTLEGNSDVLYNISAPGYLHKDVFFDAICQSKLSDQDKNDLSEFRTLFKNRILFKSQLSREYLDPEHKFKHIILYAGNFPSLRFKAHSGFASNAAFVQYLLEILPEDCAIAYSKHRLDKTENFYFEKNPRIINLSSLRKEDGDITVRIMPFVDAIVNIYSNVFMPAMVVGLPVFSYGNSVNAKFSLGTIDELPNWLEGERKISQDYSLLCDKILKYIFTHKINSRFLRNYRNSYLYIKNIKQNIENKKTYLEILPSLSTIQGYTGQFSQSKLAQNTFLDSYNQTKYEILQGFLLNDKITTIGFDIFDTLLYRPLMKPTDLFDLIEEDVYSITGLRSFNFSKTRIAAEDLARYGCIETTLDKIYEKFQETTGFNEEQISQIKQLELDMEEKLLSPRIAMKDFFHLAKSHGKKIFIASDMYLPESFIRHILGKNGYDLTDVKVFISCEVNKVKYNGTLFSYILKNELYPPSETVFIGDNIKSDIARSKDLGIIPFHYPKALEILKETKIFDKDIMHFILTNNPCHHIALIANKLFDNPFIKYDRKSIINDSSALLGYYVMGPLTLSITQWIIDKIKDKDYDKILFSSRDSRIIVDIYNYINEKIYNGNLPTGEYFYISRTSTLPA